MLVKLTDHCNGTLPPDQRELERLLRGLRWNLRLCWLCNLALLALLLIALFCLPR